jgi:hypothetical protein
MSKAAELAALIGGQSSLAMPNMITNGDCRVAQRGTSTASITGGSNFVVDRWLFNPSGHGTWTLSQNSSTGLSEFATSVKMLCTTGGGSPAASDYVSMTYNIEGFDTQILKMGTSDAERFTVSFYVKSNKTGTGIVEAQMTSGGASVEFSKSYTISQANTWEKKSVTMIANTSLAQDNKTNSTGLTLYFILDSGTNQTTGTLPTTWADQTFVNRWAGHNLAIGRNADDYMEMTGLQVDVGDVAQAFKYETYGENLKRCHRYYFRTTGQGSYPFINEHPDNKTGYVGRVSYPQVMRTAPTLSFTLCKLLQPQTDTSAYSVDGAGYIADDSFGFVKWTGSSTIGSTGDANKGFYHDDAGEFWEASAEL